MPRKLLIGIALSLGVLQWGRGVDAAANAYLYFGHALRAAGQAAEAASAYRECLRLAPNHPQAKQALNQLK